MIQLTGLNLQRGGKILLDHANLTIFNGQKIGIVGANGAGKTSLFMLLQKEVSADPSEISLPNDLVIAHIQQEISDLSVSAMDYVLQGDKEYGRLQQGLVSAEAAEDGHRIAEIHIRLAEIDGYTLPSKAAIILVGLGFTQEEFDRPISTFSGGWQMRLNLAQVLIARADVLLLDEPTNHLDLEAISWLEEWLKESKQTVLLISHDRHFLDEVTTHTVHFFDKKLTMYTGNFSSFEKQRAEKLMIQQATFDKQQRQREHLQSFVDRFRAKASKAKQAQSRMKMIERMEMVEQVRRSSPFTFQFKPAPKAGNPMLSLNGASVGYENTLILNSINFSLRENDRFGLVGANGAGKSTFIKLLAKELETMSGEMACSTKLKIGYFAQHQLDQLDVGNSAYNHVLNLDRKQSESQIRRYLGSYNFQGDQVFRPVGEFSGGEKARLVLALLIWEAPNLILLDEPTNHLDMEMREALNMALQEFEGAVVLVSHDRFLLDSVAEQLLLVADGNVTAFDGDVDDYYQWYKARQQLGSTDKKTAKKPVEISQKDQQALKQALAKLERQLEECQKQIIKLDERLAESALYEAAQQEKLQKLIAERQSRSDKAKRLEDEILELMKKL